MTHPKANVGGPVEEESVSLDEAWAEAEAALPEGWVLERVWLNGSGWDARAEPRPAFKSVPGWFLGSPSGTMWLGTGADGPTPAAALQALAAKLRPTIVDRAEGAGE